MEIFGQGIRKAVPEIQLRGMPAAPAEVSVGLSCQSALLQSHWQNLDPADTEQFVQLPGDLRAPGGIRYDTRLHIVHNRHPGSYGGRNDSAELRRLGFIPEYGDYCRSVDYHFGSPRSS